MTEPVEPIGKWYTTQDALAVISKNSGHPIRRDYLKYLVKREKILAKRINVHTLLYYQPDVDRTVVETREARFARLAAERAEKEREKQHAELSNQRLDSGS